MTKIFKISLSDKQARSKIVSDEFYKSDLFSNIFTAQDWCFDVSTSIIFEEDLLKNE